jgi:hypothetical protein
MKNFVSLAAVLFAVHAYAQGSIVICESMTVCRFPPPIFPMDVPALSFDTTSDGSVNISVDFWLSAGCQGAPDSSMAFPGQSISGAGQWFIEVDNWQYLDGIDFSIQWTIDGCPTTACVNGTTGISPDICQLE